MPIASVLRKSRGSEAALPASFAAPSAVHGFAAEMSGPDVTGSIASTNVMNATSRRGADVTDAAEARGLLTCWLWARGPGLVSFSCAGRPCCTSAAVQQCTPFAPRRSGGSERRPRQFENRTFWAGCLFSSVQGCSLFAQWAFSPRVGVWPGGPLISPPGADLVDLFALFFS